MPAGSAGDTTAKRLRQRAEDEESQGDPAPPPPVKDHISALPEAMQLRILACLPLKHAIRTSVLSRGWRHLWEHRWQDDKHPSNLLHHLRPHTPPSPKKLLASLEERGTSRLDRFSLIVETSTMSAKDFPRCLAFAARCAVEDLHVELRRPSGSAKLTFPFPASSALLARLSLRGIGVSRSSVNYRRARPFSALEVIRLHSVDIDDLGLRKMLGLCPNLRALGLHRCNGLRCIKMTAEAAPNLRILAVVECVGVTGVDVAPLSTICSFRYVGGFLPTFYLPEGASLADIYICISGQRRPSVPICIKVFNELFYDTLPEDRSKLKALTVCSNVLHVVSSLPYAGAHSALDKRGNIFQSMTELQLLMLEMKAADLANIYVFLKKSRCSNLERLFIQLPTIRDEPMVDSFDDVGVEPPDDDLENLKMVNIVNFNWSRIEVQLVSFFVEEGELFEYIITSFS